MTLSYTGGYSKLVAKLKWVEQEVKPRGAQWARDQATNLDGLAREHLTGQGRPGGEPPPLTEMTRHIYGIDGEPKGEGLINHLELEVLKVRGNKVFSTFGVPEGKPTMIGKVQDRGCVIPVTDRMRGFMSARYGIHLKQSTTHIHVPGRGWWEDSLKTTRKQAKRDLKKLMRELFR